MTMELFPWLVVGAQKNYRFQLKGTWGDENLKIHNHSTLLLFTWTWDHRRVKFPLLGKKETKIRRL